MDRPQGEPDRDDPEVAASAEAQRSDAVPPKTVWDVRLKSGTRLGTLKTFTVWLVIGMFFFNLGYGWWVAVRNDGQISPRDYYKFLVGLATWLVLTLIFTYEFRKVYRNTLKEFEEQRGVKGKQQSKDFELK